MKLASNPRISALFSRAALIGATFIALCLSNARAAELVMFEQAGCVWCEAFDREIAPIYRKTEEGLRAPLRRVDTGRSLPPDLAFIERERLTPLFVLVDKGREIGRIRGYPGEDSFWGLLSVLMQKLDASGTGADRAQLLEKKLLVDEKSPVF
jgi:thioredoxin-related protein